MSATLVRGDATLEDRYIAESGTVLMSGIQALVRLTLDQRRLDVRHGHATGVFVSGYQGSPLGGVDLEMGRARRHLDPAGVVFQPGLNEELAATAVAGTQLLGELSARRLDGVTGIWYGKNPGFDRAADAIRHGNISGTAPLGGAVAWIGDDPTAKSSTVPSSCGPMCRSLQLPLLAPGSVSELLSLGLHAVAMSRYAGLWTGLQIVADVADATASVDVAAALESIPQMPVRDVFRPPVMLPPTNLDAELDLMASRLELAREYARVAQLNRIVSEPERPRLAIVASGIGFHAVLRALDDLGLDDAAREALGIRLVSLAMPWPVDRHELRRLCADVETVLVVEDKLPFVEANLKEALYRTANAPLVVGKDDADGRPLLPLRSGLAADDVASALVRVLDPAALPEQARARGAALEAARRPTPGAAPLPKRTPYFCSGCPHSTSTRAQPDQLVGVGIGCHTLVAVDDGDRRGQLVGMVQMGGEGAQWIGLAPFTDDPHFIQNIGDGTFHHSGSLAVRAAVAAGVNITYKLLYNDAVAMTGGQQPQGKLDIPSLTRLLALEGVKRIVVTTPEPDRYRDISLSEIAAVRHRDDLQQAQLELAAVPGVTVLIHDDQCATEKRRLRKRGKLQAPPERVWINERVCEGCGDCGEKSTCLSVQPVATEFGRKTQIHQSSCNQDLTCLKGDCPSFLIVTPTEKRERPALPVLSVQLPAPVMRVGADVLVRMPGVGGTGVVTASAILQMAVHLDGRFAAGLEQIGLAQKGGPVLSDLRIADTPIDGQLRATHASADVILGFDLLGAAAPDTLTVADPARTVAVLNVAQVPTAGMITDPRASSIAPMIAIRRIEAVTRADENAYLDGLELAERLFGDHMPANMIMVGAAFQHGCLPISEAAVEAAIRLNGAAVESNLAAFRWGRASIADPEAVAAALAPAIPERPPVDAATQARLERAGATGELRRLLEVRVPELAAFQNAAHAERYLDDVMRIASIERERTGGDSSAVAEAYAQGLFKLLAYKDEYEVARLHLDAVEEQRRRAQFGDDAKVQILLHPPVLRALGMQRKLRLGAWAFPALRGLRAGRHLRGTRLDPFGYASVRRLERALIGEYGALVESALEHLTPATAAQVAEIAALPDVIRGYEEVKLRTVDEFRLRAQALLENLSAGSRGSAQALEVVQVGG